MRQFLSLRILIASTIVLLAACVPPPPPPAPVTICLPMGDVTPAQQAAAANALAANPDPAELAIVQDWIAMRAANKACLAKSAKAPS